MPRSKPPSADFKRRTAKVGRKLAPANETRVEVKFGTLAVRAAPSLPASAGGAASLRAALIHVRAATVGARREALQAIRSARSSEPALVARAAADVADTLGGALADDDGGVRALAGAQCAGLVRDLSGATARVLLPSLRARIDAALARAHTRLDAVGAVGALWFRARASTTAALAPAAPSIIAALVPLLDAGAHGATAVLSCAAAVVPRVLCVGSSASAEVGALSRSKLTPLDARIAVAVVLRVLLRALGDGKGAAVNLGTDRGEDDGDSNRSESEDDEEDAADDEDLSLSGEVVGAWSGEGRSFRNAAAPVTVGWQAGVHASVPGVGYAPRQPNGDSFAQLLASSCAKRGANVWKSGGVGGILGSDGGEDSSSSLAQLPAVIVAEAIAHLLSLWAELFPGSAVATCSASTALTLGVLVDTIHALLTIGIFPAALEATSPLARYSVFAGEVPGGSTDADAIRVLLAASRTQKGQHDAIMFAALAVRAVRAAILRPFPVSGADDASSVSACFASASLASLNARIAMLAAVLSPSASDEAAAVARHRMVPPRATTIRAKRSRPAASAGDDDDDVHDGGESAPLIAPRVTFPSAAALARAALTHASADAKVDAFCRGAMTAASSEGGTERGAGGSTSPSASASAILPALLSFVVVRRLARSATHSATALCDDLSKLLGAAPRGSNLQGVALRVVSDALLRGSVGATPLVRNAWVRALPRYVWALRAGTTPSAAAARDAALEALAAEARIVGGGSMDDARSAALADAARALPPLIYAVVNTGAGVGGGGEGVWGALPPPAFASLLSALFSAPLVARPTDAALRAFAHGVRSPQAPLRARSALADAVVFALLAAGAPHALAAVGSSRGGALLPCEPRVTATTRVDPGASAASAFALSVALGRSVTTSLFASAPLFSVAAAAPHDDVPSETDEDDDAYDATLAIAARALRFVAGAAVGGTHALAPAIDAAIDAAIAPVSSTDAIERTRVSLRDAAARATLSLALRDSTGSDVDTIRSPTVDALIALTLDGGADANQVAATGADVRALVLGPTSNAAAPFSCKKRASPDSVAAATHWLLSRGANGANSRLLDAALAVLDASTAANFNADKGRIFRAAAIVQLLRDADFVKAASSLRDRIATSARRAANALASLPAATSVWSMLSTL